MTKPDKLDQLGPIVFILMLSFLFDFKAAKFAIRPRSNPNIGTLQAAARLSSSHKAVISSLKFRFSLLFPFYL